MTLKPLSLLFRRARALLAGLLLVLPAGLCAQPATPGDAAPAVPFMSPLKDLPADLAAMQAHHIPMLLFFHASYCPYCQQVDSEFIQPMADDPAYRHRLIIRRVLVDSDGGFVGRDGKHESYASLAHRFDIHLVPVVLFIGPDGRQIGNPLRGITVPDFYPYYLNQGIDLAEHCAQTPSDPACRPDEDQRNL